MSELAVYQPETTLAEKIEWSRAMAPATLLPKQYRDNPGNLLFAVEYADALGVERIHAITAIHVIDGKPSASADLIAGLIRRAGHKLRIMGDDTYAEAHLIRADDTEFTYVARWDMDKARQAGLLGKGTWKNYPGALLRSRAITEVGRMGASDALYGCIYTPEELGAEVDANGAPVNPRAIQQSPASGADRMRQALGKGDPGAEPEAASDADALTDRTRGRMFALLTERGITDADEQRRGMAHILGRPIASRSELTEADALAVIRTLEARPPDTTPPDADQATGEVSAEYDPTVEEGWKS